MRLRAIAAVGVVLCAATTSLSIYLGIAEHAYTRPLGHNALGLDRGQVLCFPTTTSPHPTTKQVPCATDGSFRP